ncbi:DUF1501 domain-containing protein, partial [uncultured Bradyrhizobium sp.]|uniref:DUF1501 domain-containing protein n=1 Tax=uncultured Bradyrhizobium sp. TaxID=199684 RepID=UPI0026059FCA
MEQPDAQAEVAQAEREVERRGRLADTALAAGDGQHAADMSRALGRDGRLGAALIDRPIDALLADLEQRGLLDSTLIVWGGEFGRQAVSQGGNGGDGGKGGDVWLLADRNVASLLAFRDHPHRRGSNGVHGKGKDLHGRRGEDLIVHVPEGTVA